LQRVGGFSSSSLFFLLNGALMPKIKRELEYRFLYTLGLKGTIRILKFLKKHGKGQYKDLLELDLIVSTLNDRVRTLIKMGLISHNITLIEKREEWYTLTKKGKKVLNLVLKLEKVIKEQ